MNTMNEETFYEALGETPQAPADAYGAIRSKIHGDRLRARSVWAVAATLVFAAGLWLYQTDRTVAPQASAASGNGAALETELEQIAAYLNGDDLAQVVGLYALSDE